MHFSVREKSLRPRSSGFSLLSILIAIGLTSVLIMTVLQIGRMINSQSRYVANIEDIDNVTKQVASLLSIPANCLALYGGETISLANIGSSATTQLDVVAKTPYAGGDPMNKVSSGHLKLTAMGMILKRSLAGVGQPWYQGDAVIQVDDPADPGRFAARKIAVNFQFDSSNMLVGCVAAGSSGSMVTTAIVRTTAGGEAIPWGQCGAGQVMVGMDESGVICKGGGQTTTGKGCTGVGCKAYDGGDCYGDGCFTNGDYCDGTGCVACGTCASCAGNGASCKQTGCCAGPACAACNP